MILCNGDKPILEFDLEDMYIRVLDNAFLPYPLKDYIKTSDYSSPKRSKESVRHIEVFRDFLANRTINLHREHAKAILGSLSLPQSLKTEERLKIVLACSGLSMTDNFWIKEEKDNRCFKEVCLRNHHLKDSAYPISVLGETLSATGDVLNPDLATDGMFAKTWYRGEDCIELWKTDRTIDFSNTKAEVKASRLLDCTNVNHVKYTLFKKDDIYIAKCDCLANDKISLVSAFDLMDWCEHTGNNFFDCFVERFKEDIAKMAVMDYILANTDRHLGNIQFLVSNDTNEVISLAPLFDHNQALLADEIGTDVSELIYDLTGKTMLESAIMFYPYANLSIDIEEFPEKCRERFQRIGKSLQISRSNRFAKKTSIQRTSEIER